MKKDILFIFLGLSITQLAQSTEIDFALNWKPEPEFGGFYEADRTGLYEAEKLKVKIIPGGAGQPVAQMLAAKKVKLGIVSADEVILARNQGAKIKAIFAVYQNNPQGFMVRADRNISSLKELFQTPGTIALQKGLPFSVWLNKKLAPIQATQVPFTGGVGLFIKDRLYAQQCFVTSEPLAAEAAGIESKTFLISESGFNPYLVVVAAHEDTIKNEKNLIVNFLKASENGWSTYLKKPKQTNELIHKLNPSLSLEVLEKISKLHEPFIDTGVTKKFGLGAMQLERWNVLYEQLQEIGLVKANLKPEDFFEKKMHLEK